MPATIRQCAPDLYLIVLAPPIAGFDEFIGAWLINGPAMTGLVDVGPAVTAQPLIDAIAAVGVAHLDYIILTHIHLDHAGAVGHIARRFPEATVVCHPRGIPHIIDPQRLWEGTLKTLGDTGRAYGPMLPVDPEAIASDDQLAAAPFRLLDTPGHSPHHFAVASGRYLFAGEAGGVCLPLPDGGIYLRPATPPRFFLETSLASIDRIMDARPEILCYGHLGMQTDAMGLLADHRDQLLHWKKILAPDVASVADAEAHIARWIDLMLSSDPRLAGFDRLAPSAQARERSFLRNSVRGFVGYLMVTENCSGET
jgi:glyoxylase-like metal-dependent hydrolase (beta-lactamase superfamily II)